MLHFWPAVDYDFFVHGQRRPIENKLKNRAVILNSQPTRICHAHLAPGYNGKESVGWVKLNLITTTTHMFNCKHFSWNWCNWNMANTDKQCIICKKNLISTIAKTPLQYSHSDSYLIWLMLEGGHYFCSTPTVPVPWRGSWPLRKSCCHLRRSSFVSHKRKNCQWVAMSTQRVKMRSI